MAKLMFENYIDEKREQRFYIYYMLKRDVDNMKKIILRNKESSEFFAREYEQVKYKWFRNEEKI
jgi:hypothetical protein